MFQLFKYCVYSHYVLFYIIKIMPIEDLELLKCREQELNPTKIASQMLKCIIFSLFSVLISVCSTHFYLKTQYIVYLFLTSAFIQFCLSIVLLSISRPPTRLTNRTKIHKMWEILKIGSTERSFILRAIIISYILHQ